MADVVVAQTNGFEVNRDGTWRKWSQSRDGSLIEQRGSNYWGPRHESPCRVYWGSHGCMLERGHAGEHRCHCDLDGDFDPVTRLDADGVLNVGAPPYYGPETRFFGEDA